MAQMVRSLSRRPSLFEKAPSSFWTDPYIRRHVLNAHLSHDTDDASRRPALIDDSVNWIDSRISDAPIRNLLDLGCGPGLYAYRFAKLGWRVTGIDYSVTSVAYAKRTGPRDLDNRPKFRRGDLRKFPLRERYGAITLIYGGFGVLSDVDRERLMHRVREALEPGGYFVFDVFTKAYTKKRRETRDWYTETRDGFWHRGRHAVLQESIDYASNVLLIRYIVIPAVGGVKRFHLWYRPFDSDGIRSLIESAGFRDVTLYGSLSGEPVDPEGEWIGVVCRR